MKYEMSCDCGETMSVEASSRDEALARMKEMMNEDAIKQHMAEKHPGQAIPTVEQGHAMIEQNLRQAH